VIGAEADGGPGEQEERGEDEKHHAARIGRGSPLDEWQERP
jgi:hypothetical protein